MDVEKINQLLALMKEHDLAEVEIEEDGVKIRLRRGAKDMVDVSAVNMGIQSAVLAAQAAATAPPTKPADTQEIKSPMVGTFYRSPAPEAEAFVSIGQEINEETVVCIIEAMKVMNEIKAELHGELVAVLVENGEPVEFGQPLMLVKGAGSSAAPSAT